MYRLFSCLVCPKKASPCVHCASKETERYGSWKPAGSRRSLRRFKCRDCGKTWSLGRRSEAGAPILSDVRILSESLERGSVRILGRRFEKAKGTIMKIVHRTARRLMTSRAVAATLSPKWSGILVVDGLYVRVFDRLSAAFTGRLTSSEKKAVHRRSWLCSIDSGTGDIPHHALADEESMVDLVLFFRELKAMEYPLKALVCDGNDDIVRAARKVYGEGFLVQRCTRHFLEGLRTKAAEEGMREDPDTQMLIFRMQRVIEARSLEEGSNALASLRAKTAGKLSALHKKLLAEFDRLLPVLTTHLCHPELSIPHTSNEIENLFKQTRLRLKSIGRFSGGYRTARDYLNAWTLWRRITPFTDCRGTRKARNKKSPLQMAGSGAVDMAFFVSLKPT